MNRYPLWKYIVIAVALLIGVFYTLPNFFAEVPAVQVSTSKSNVKIDASTLQRKRKRYVPYDAAPAAARLGQSPLR
jgi:preprotein translocase subunit SecD